MRTEEAYVVDAWKIINNEFIKCDRDDVIYSIHDPSFKYIIGNSVRPTNGYTNSLNNHLTDCLSNIPYPYSNYYN